MYKKPVIAAVLLVAALPLTAQAGEKAGPSIGISSYALAVANNGTGTTKTDSFSGLGLVATLPLNDLLAVRGHLYSLKGAQDGKGTILSASSVKVSGIDAAVLVGLNWDAGFNLYIGYGAFSESYTGLPATVSNSKFTGTAATVGLGYRGDTLGIEFSYQLRNKKPYADQMFNNAGDTVALSGSLDLSLYF